MNVEYILLDLWLERTRLLSPGVRDTSHLDSSALTKYDTNRRIDRSAQVRVWVDVC